MASGDGRKLSFSERDRMRREGSPHERASEGLRSKEATAQYLRKIDRLFSGAESEAEKLAAAVRDAHGTPKLAQACHAYLQQIGVPTDASLVSMFLDSRDSALILSVLEVFGDAVRAGEAEISRGLQSQLRTLADGADEQLAVLAEELLQGL